MKEKQLIDYLEEKKEYLDIMQKGIGNQNGSSWWYANRSSDKCINCKINSYVYTEKVLALLSETEKEKIKLLGLDINEICQDFVWGGDYNFDFSWIWQARQDIEEELSQFDYFSNIEYCGRSGGWACIVYNFDIRSSDGWTLDDSLEDAPLKDLKELQKQVKQALENINKVEIIFTEAYERLCRELKEPKNYIDEVRYAIERKKEFFIDDVDIKKDLLEKIKALQ